LNWIKLPSISRSTIIWTAVLLILCAIYLTATLGLGSGIRFDVPFTYEGDGLEYNLLTKTMIETGWWMENPRTGTPGILEMYDYAVGSNLDFFIMKLISLFSGNYAVVMNSFYILGFFLTAICSLYVFRNLQISYPIGVFGSIIFSFLYYHFYRIGHVNLCAYFMVPLIILVILWVCQGELLFFRRSEEKGKGISSRLAITEKGIVAIIIIFITSTHSYYGFFGLLLLGAATFYAVSRSYDLILLFNGIIASVLLAVFAMLNKLPSLLYSISHGSSFVMSYRYAYEAEVWGLKLIQMVLPTPGHNISFLAEIAHKYTLNRPLVNENMSASLGIIATLGFILLLGWIFLRNYEPLKYRLKNRAAVMDHLSFLTITAILIGTIGGISAIIAQVFPDIHSYNRISLFIGFFGILAIVYLLQIIFEQYRSRPYFCPVFLVLLLVVTSAGVYDQVPAGFAMTPGSERELEFSSQEEFFSGIEAQMPTGAAAFILPDIGGFPHSNPPGNIKGLDSVKPYLHTHDMKWNYPSMKGRFWDNWQAAVAISPPEEVLTHLYHSGFSGLLIDGYGYEDEGTDIIASYKTITGVTPIISKDGRYAFFDLTRYMESKRAGKTAGQIETEKQQYIQTMEQRSELNDPLLGVQIRNVQ
jgi:phosphoglycerol transferase